MPRASATVAFARPLTAGTNWFFRRLHVISPYCTKAYSITVVPATSKPYSCDSDCSAIFSKVPVGCGLARAEGPAVNGPAREGGTLRAPRAYPQICRMPVRLLWHDDARRVMLALLRRPRSPGMTAFQAADGPVYSVFSSFLKSGVSISTDCSELSKRGIGAMARGEVSVTCPKCGFLTRMPPAALQRDNYYCSRCGSHIPLSGVVAGADEEGKGPRRSFSKRPYRPGRRR